jgi:hypothetical protein
MALATKPFPAELVGPLRQVRQGPQLRLPARFSHGLFLAIATTSCNSSAKVGWERFIRLATANSTALSP